ncbi:MAG: hypothetical protein HZA90_16420 [Verrucomicrobia bacterium]|nr:hypothetical protein [Verrucomicrobiota bacterium]
MALNHSVDVLRTPLGTAKHGGFFHGAALYGGAIAGMFHDFHQSRMRFSCAVGHNESSAACIVEREVEELNPEVMEFGFTNTPALRSRQFGFRACARCSVFVG